MVAIALKRNQTGARTCHSSNSSLRISSCEVVVAVVDGALVEDALTCKDDDDEVVEDSSCEEAEEAS
jgi:hypothetical protein